MSPYVEKDGTLINRVTEVIGAGDCEATAFIEKDPKLRQNARTSHIVVLPGRLLHTEIEKDLKREMGLVEDRAPLSDLEKKLYGKIYNQHKTMRAKDPTCQTTYSDIMKTVKDCYANYLAFRADHPLTPLLVEKRMYSKTYRVGGTVDLVGLFTVKGYTIRDTPDKKNLPKKRYWKICDHNTVCKCTKQKVVCVGDWKSSKRKQDGHRIQMSAYLCMLEETGILDQYRKKGYHVCWETWSILFGVHGYKKYKTPYQIHHYSPDVTDFLVRGEVHANARYMTVNVKGNVGLKGRCMFCSYFLSCPDRLSWNFNEEIEFNNFFTREELAKLNLLASKTKGEAFKDLREKATRYLAIAKKQEEEIEKVVPEVLQQIEQEISLLTGQR